MLTAIRQSDVLKVLARDSTKLEAPFRCPKCKSEMVLRKGRIKAHHFAHKPPITCALGSGESEQHYRAKLEIFDALKNEANVLEAELEKDFGISVADVYVKISGVPVALEIQRSNLTVNEIVSRTRNYHRLGVSVLWLGLPSSDLSTDKYSPKAWEKWCHAAYFGRTYYWSHGQVILPVHFSPYRIHVAATSWYEDGSEQSAGGYDRNSKRWRTPQKGVPMLLAHHFSSRQRPAWSGGSIDIPQSTLFVDRQQKWWKDD